MVVPFLGPGGSNGDLFRSGLSGSDEFARPTQCLERLMARAGARFSANLRVFARRFYDRNAEFVNPGGDVTRAGDPLQIRLGSQRR
jgi:hypothetical protein